MWAKKKEGKPLLFMGDQEEVGRGKIPFSITIIISIRGIIIIIIMMPNHQKPAGRQEDGDEKVEEKEEAKD